MPQQQEVVIVGADGQEHVFPPGFDPKKAAEIVRGKSAAPAPQAAPAPERTWGDTALDVAKGIGKGAAATVANVVELGANAGIVPGVMPAGFNQSMRHPMFTRAEEATTATNTPQMVGKGLETVAELAMPVLKGGQAVINAIPRAGRAAGKFQDVMGAARQMPVDITGPGNVALRIQELADAGATMPMAVRKFLLRVTNPDKAPMEYKEGRDFAHNISRLSANEKMSLTPVVAREVAEMRMALNKANGQAAAKAGKGKEYAEAMNEYGKAMRLRSAIDDVVKGAKRAVPVAGVGAGAYWLTSKISKLLGGD